MAFLDLLRVVHPFGLRKQRGGFQRYIGYTARKVLSLAANDGEMQVSVRCIDLPYPSRAPLFGV
jgi:hypothetical protein